MATITDEEQDALIAKYNTDNKKAWRQEVTRLIRENPIEYKILELGKSGNHATHLTVSQFEQALPTLKKPLIEAIFDDIDSVDDLTGDGQLKMTTIHRWVNNKKRRKKNLTIKDEGFVFDKLKKFQFKDLDKDENGLLDRDEIQFQFTKYGGVDPGIVDVIFDNIDDNGDGNISVKEWFQWQQKFEKIDLAQLLFPQKESDDNKESYANGNEDTKETEAETEKGGYQLREMTDNPKGKTNSWSRSQSVSIKFDEPETANASNDEKDNKESREMTDNPKGKTNSWSRSKSVSIKFEEYEKEAIREIPSQQLYILSPSNKWRECEVSQVLDNGEKWKVHYKGFSAKHDEILETNSERLTIKKPEQVIPKKKSRASSGKQYNETDETEERVWCQSVNDKNIYRECVIVQEKDDKYNLHFISYHQKYDCWIEKTSPRLQKKRPRGDSLVKGDNLSCYSDDFKGWLEVEVVNVEKNKICLSWVGSNNLESIWIPINSKRLCINHKKHNAPPPQGY